MPELGRAILVLGCFVAVGSLLMVLAVPPGTAEFVITIAALVLGLALAGLGIAVQQFRGDP